MKNYSILGHSIFNVNYENEELEKKKTIQI